MSAAVSFIVFLPNARGGCTETVVRVTSATRHRRIFRTRKYTRIDVDMTARGWIWATSSELYLGVSINPRFFVSANSPKELGYPNNSGGHFIPDLQYTTLENGFFEEKVN